MRILTACSIMLFIILFGSCRDNNIRQQSMKNSIMGVWEYVNDDLLKNVNGMSFFTEEHFAFVVNYRSADSSSSERILAHSGTYIQEDSIITATVLFSHDRSLVGSKLRWIHSVEGDFAFYDVIDRNGRILESGKVKRIEY